MCTCIYNEDPHTEDPHEGGSSHLLHEDGCYNTRNKYKTGHPVGQ